LTEIECAFIEKIFTVKPRRRRNNTNLKHL